MDYMGRKWMGKGGYMFRLFVQNYFCDGQRG